MIRNSSSPKRTSFIHIGKSDYWMLTKVLYKIPLYFWVLSELHKASVFYRASR